MSINKKVQKILNEQINHELFSAYLYLAMVAYFEGKNLSGFAHWMKKQVDEELSHAMKIFAYLYERQGEVSLKAIAQPALIWKSPLDVFESAYKHEQKVTKLIEACYDTAVKEDDKATVSFLQWFIDEQVEEEATADGIVQKLKMIKGAPQGLLMFDSILGKRK